MKPSIVFLCLMTVACGGAKAIPAVPPEGTTTGMVAKTQIDSSTPAASTEATRSTDPHAGGAATTPAKDADAEPASSAGAVQTPPPVSYAFTMDIEPCENNELVTRTFGPELIAHRQADGTLLLDDESLNLWLQECPAPPLQITPELVKKRFDQDGFKHNLTCAILWGNRADALVELNECNSDQITESTCPLPHKPEDPRPLYHVKTPSKCADKAVLQGWIANAPPVTLAYDTLSVCGVLTMAGTAVPRFIVPESISGTAVKRYTAIDANENVNPPIGLNDGWWICVTEGRVVKEPVEVEEYGTIIINAFESVQANWEKGME